MNVMIDTNPKEIEAVPVKPPPAEQLRGREATFAKEGERRNRYHLPSSLRSTSPVGYRTRISMTKKEVQEAMTLLSMSRPSSFSEGSGVTESELFEESSLGVLSSRQSTNFRGHRQTTLGPDGSKEAQALLSQLSGGVGEALPGAAHTHLVFSRPYRTPFTLLLTLVGHKPLKSLVTAPLRAYRKRVHQVDDIPTIGYLQRLHVGILADAMERAAVIASSGKRRAQVLLAPFYGEAAKENTATIRKLEALGGLTMTDRAKGWRLALVAQVGGAAPGEEILLSSDLCRKLGANLMAFRSERIQPGVNQEEKAPAAYQERQDMDVSDQLTVMAGRAGYNAFSHWTGSDREQSKHLLIHDRIDVLTSGGKERLRGLRDMLSSITDRVVETLPKWADLPTGKAFSRNASRGRKAFALAGQRIYVGGLCKDEIADAGIDWDLAVCAFGASCSRGALVAELSGCIDIPEGCDLLAGICLMAGPVNQNDIGKSFYGVPDILAQPFPQRDPTSLLVWTLKAKTVADPIGNEEQLLNAKRKGALVDLRTGPHEIINVQINGALVPMRKNGEQVNNERAFADQLNFVTSADGQEIPGNQGEPWSKELASRLVWGD